MDRQTTRVTKDTAGHDVGTLWTMTRHGSRARCALISVGGEWELCVLVDGAALCAERCPTTTEVFNLAERWRTRLNERGWARVTPRRPLDSASV
ncbi:MAG: hypothetical protein H0X67_01435 [Acidobacteria bacterium]|nr:hypothetical protein [Acidobacteriota bacterium]